MMKEEFTEPTGNTVRQDTFPFDLFVLDMNQVGALLYRRPQELSIRDITGVTYLLEGLGHIT